MKFVSSIIALIGFVSLSQAISTITELDLDKYTGFWVQAYGNPFVFTTFEHNGVCVGATYELNDNGTISVHNQMRISTYDGELQTIEGYATIPNPDEPGKISVKFPQNYFSAPYWIIQLGPDTYGESGQYEYSIVSDPFKISLFVLVRDLETFKANYEVDVLSFLEENGFTHAWNKPVETSQDNCVYVSNSQSLAVNQAFPEEKTSTPITVPSLDVSKYIGRWYQVYAGSFSFIKTEHNGTCIAADYGILSTGNISVFNQEVTTDGQYETISGCAYAPDASQPGQLYVQFPFTNGEYWIVKLGPDTYGDDGLYQYSIVTNHDQVSLFVIARDIETFKSDYQEEVLEYLASNGYDNIWNTPIETVHENCNYLQPPTTPKPVYLRGF